jgi:hypothetical protein
MTTTLGTSILVALLASAACKKEEPAKAAAATAGSATSAATTGKDNDKDKDKGHGKNKDKSKDKGHDKLTPPPMLADAGAAGAAANPTLPVPFGTCPPQAALDTFATATWSAAGPGATRVITCAPAAFAKAPGYALLVQDTVPGESRTTRLAAVSAAGTVLASLKEEASGQGSLDEQLLAVSDLQLDGDAELLVQSSSERMPIDPVVTGYQLRAGALTPLGALPIAFDDSMMDPTKPKLCDGVFATTPTGATITVSKRRGQPGADACVGKKGVYGLTVVGDQLTAALLRPLPGAGAPAGGSADDDE